MRESVFRAGAQKMNTHIKSNCLHRLIIWVGDGGRETIVGAHCQRAGRVHASVSNALKRPERVSADLRARVLEVATRIGYAGPIAAVEFLPKGRADTIGVLFTAELTVAMRDPAAVAFLEGLSVVCEERGAKCPAVPGRRRSGWCPEGDGFRCAG